MTLRNYWVLSVVNVEDLDNPLIFKATVDWVEHFYRAQEFYENIIRYNQNNHASKV